MRKILLCLVLCIALLASACSGQQQSSQESSGGSSSQPEETGYPVTVADLTLNERPEKVVSLSPSLTELVYDLGYGDQLVGVSSYCTYPEAVQSATDCGTVLDPDIEAIRATGATLVLASGKPTEEDLIALQQAGIDTVVLAPSSKLGELETLYQDLATLLAGSIDGAARGKELYAERSALLDSLSAAVERYLDAGGEKLEAAYVRLVPYTLATSDTLEGRLLEQVGFLNSASAYGQWYYPEDKLVELEPQVIFYSDQIDPDELLEHPNYKTVAAVTDEMCLSIDMDAFECHGGRMFEILEGMVKFAYPDAFSSDGADTESEAQEETPDEA